MSVLSICLKGFEGHLDDLLQLVEKEKVDLFEVALSALLGNFLHIVSVEPTAHLEEGGLFLAQAAQLAVLKSRFLLPKLPALAEDEVSDAERQRALKERLAEYEVFQDAARQLGQRELLGRDVFLRGRAGAEEPPEPELSLELFSLLEAFDKVLQRFQQRSPHEVVLQQLSLAERIVQVLERLEDTEQLSFEALFDDVADRSGLVLTFLSVLELAKRMLLRIWQDGRDQSIQLSLRRDAQERHQEQKS